MDSLSGISDFNLLPGGTHCSDRGRAADLLARRCFNRLTVYDKAGGPT